MRFRYLGVVYAAALLIAAPGAFADTAVYANITGSTGSSASGTIGGVSFTYSGETAFVNQSGNSTNYFNPVSTWESTTVSNAPSDGAIIAINGTDSVHTLTFSAPVTDLIFAEVSLGGGNTTTSYTFDQAFTVLSCGPSANFGGGCSGGPNVGFTGSVLAGDEWDGTIEFAGPISSLSWTGADPEYWNGFDIGLLPQSTSPTPEPSSLILLGTGLLSGAGVLRRRFMRR